MARVPRRSAHLDLVANAQDLRHFRLELAIAPLQVVTHLVRLDRMGRQDLVHRSPGRAGKARVAGSRSVVAGVRR